MSKPVTVIDLTAHAEKVIESSVFAASKCKTSRKRKRDRSQINYVPYKRKETSEKTHFRYWTTLKNSADTTKSESDTESESEWAAPDRELVSDSSIADDDENWVDDSVELERQGDDLMIEDDNYVRRLIDFYKTTKPRTKSRGVQTQ